MTASKGTAWYSAKAEELKMLAAGDDWRQNILALLAQHTVDPRDVRGGKNKVVGMSRFNVALADHAALAIYRACKERDMIVSTYLRCSIVTRVAKDLDLDACDLLQGAADPGAGGNRRYKGGNDQVTGAHREYRPCRHVSGFVIP